VRALNAATMFEIPSLNSSISSISITVRL
jgi:hypothetical protein